MVMTIVASFTHCPMHVKIDALSSRFTVRRHCRLHQLVHIMSARSMLLWVAMGGMIATSNTAHADSTTWLDGCPHPAITTLLFSSLNLSFPGFDNVNAALKAGPIS